MDGARLQPASAGKVSLNIVGLMGSIGHGAPEGVTQICALIAMALCDRDWDSVAVHLLQILQLQTAHPGRTGCTLCNVQLC